MPVPPVVPNLSTTSARPSPLVSRSPTWPAGMAATRPRFEDLRLTNTSPFGATTRCLAAPMLSANTVAQNPEGSRRPPWSWVHAALVRTWEIAPLPTGPGLGLGLGLALVQAATTKPHRAADKASTNNGYRARILMTSSVSGVLGWPEDVATRIPYAERLQLAGSSRPC